MNFRKFTLLGVMMLSSLATVSAQTIYETILSGSQEVPAVHTVANGQVSAILDGNELVVLGEFNHLSSKYNINVAGGAHIHMAYAGENGSIVLSLDPMLDEDSLGGIINDTFTLNSAQILALQTRQMYVNIHSMNYPAGELRGQLTPQAEEHFFSHLSGEAEVPPVTTFGRGAVIVELNNDTITVSGHFDSLGSKYDTAVAGGSHLHFGAAGTNGSITITLNPTLENDSMGGYYEAANNKFAVTSNQMDSLMNMRMYVNIHTENEQAGELRGQLMTLDYTMMMAKLSGIQEVPPISTQASGMVWLKQSGNQLIVAGNFMGLMSDYAFDIAGGAHLHMAPAGRNGNVIIPLNTEIDNDNRGGMLWADSNSYTLTGAQMEALSNRQIYVNIHSDMYQAGELRGQVTPMADAVHFANLYGSNEVPPVNTEARGAAIIEVNGSDITLTGSFNDLESDYATDIGGTGSGAHLHMAYAGQNGGVEYSLTPMVDGSNRNGVFMPGDNTTTLTSAQMEAMMGRQIYVNVHSDDQAAGEVRGQVLPIAHAISGASLAGTNEVQPIISGAIGGVALEIHEDTLVVTGAFSDLGSDLATDIAGGVHLHMGGPGENGAVQIPLSTEVDGDNRGGHFMADSNMYTLTNAQKMNIMNGDYYVNIHSENFNSGELRGQVLNEGNMFPMMSSISSPSDGANIQIDGKPSDPFQVTWMSADDPDGNEVVYIWQLAADMNFSTVLINVNTGADTMFMTDLETVDSILEANNVSVGSNVTLYHRVISSDGSVRTPGATLTAEIERGNVVSINEVEDGFSASRVYPNPAQNQTTLDFHLKEQGAVQLEVYNVTGQKVISKDLGIRSAGSSIITLDLEQLNAGFYNYRLIRTGASGVETGRFEVTR